MGEIYIGVERINLQINGLINVQLDKFKSINCYLIKNISHLYVYIIIIGHITKKCDNQLVPMRE